VLINKVIIYF